MSSNKRASTSALIRKEDAARTHADWAVLDAVSLRLKCNEYNVVASGKKDILIDRLVEFFRSEKSPTPHPSERSASESEVEEQEEFELGIGEEAAVFDDNKDGAATNTARNSRKKSDNSATTTKNNRIKDGGRPKHGGKKSANAKQRRASPPSKRQHSPRAKATSPTPRSPDFSLQSIKPPSHHQQQQQQQNLPELSALDNKMDIIIQTLQHTQGGRESGFVVRIYQSNWRCWYDTSVGANVCGREIGRAHV